MDWMGSSEFERLLAIVEPYTYRKYLTLPKMLINASSDEFFLPDSWQFYWSELCGEKHIRYVPNSGHSLKKTDAAETLIAFYHSIVTGTSRPDFEWHVQNGSIHITTDPKNQPEKITLWQATNDSARTFRYDLVGKIWTSTSIELNESGHYEVHVDSPAKGWKAFFVELIFPGPGKYPFKQTTGVTVVPETLPFPKYTPNPPRGTR